MSSVYPRTSEAHCKAHDECRRYPHCMPPLGNAMNTLNMMLHALCKTGASLSILNLSLVSCCWFRLAKAGVGTVFCLQEDSDMAYFSLDINPIIKRCQDREDIKHVRFPIRDFDPFSLRQRLPEAVLVLQREAASGRGKLYIHCTAGVCQCRVLPSCGSLNPA